jgi:hypothetical protein
VASIGKDAGVAAVGGAIGACVGFAISTFAMRGAAQADAKATIRPTRFELLSARL